MDFSIDSGTLAGLVARHAVAADLARFLEVASQPEPEAEFLAHYKAKDGEKAAHANLPAYLHNHDVVEVLPLLLGGLRAAGDAGSLALAHEALGAVLARWGWDRDACAGGELPFHPDDPPAVLTGDEKSRLWDALKAIGDETARGDLRGDGQFSPRGVYRPPDPGENLTVPSQPNEDELAERLYEKGHYKKSALVEFMKGKRWATLDEIKYHVQDGRTGRDIRDGSVKGLASEATKAVKELGSSLEYRVRGHRLLKLQPGE